MQVGLERTGSLDGCVERPPHGPVVQLDGFRLMVVDGHFERVVVGAGVEDLEPLGMRRGAGLRTVGLAKAARLGPLERC